MRILLYGMMRSVLAFSVVCLIGGSRALPASADAECTEDGGPSQGCIAFSSAYYKCIADAGEDWEKKFSCAAEEDDIWNARLSRAMMSLRPLNSIRPTLMESVVRETEAFEVESRRHCIDHYLPLANDLGHLRTHFITGICSLNRRVMFVLEIERLANTAKDVGMMPKGK